MARTRYPKLPPSIMRWVWIRRVAFTVVGAALVLGGLLEFGQGGLVVGVMLVIAGVALTGAAWVHPLSQYVFTSIATALVAIFIASGDPWVRIGVAVALAFLVTAGLLRHASGVDPASLRLVEPASIMRHAEATRDAFASLGFTQMGAMGANAAGREIVATIMAGPDGRTYASFTDATISVMSVFADERILATVTSAFAANPPWILMNPEVGGSPEELVAGHQRALDLVAERDAEPLLLDSDEIPSIELRSEHRHVIWLDANPFRLRPLEAQEPLWRRLGRYQEVEDWMASSVPPSEVDLGPSTGA